MYEKFFSLRTKPFDLVPNPDFIYPSHTHNKAMNYLDYGIREKIGFMLLTGEVGSGKTTLIRDLIKKIHPRVNLAKVFNTKVSAGQLLAMINDDFGLDIEGKDKVMLLRDLNDFLIEQYAQGCHSVLIIDEAQNLDANLLEEVRMLSNLETDRTKLLQIILVGQPELKRTLARPEIRQLRQRISISCHIYHLTKEETEEYILHRLEVAGNRQAVKFSEGAVDVIHGFARGVPRIINITCDFILLTACAEETREITQELVNDVIFSLDADGGYWGDDESRETRDEHPDGKTQELLKRLEGIEKEVLKTNELLESYISKNVADWTSFSERLRQMIQQIDNANGKVPTDAARNRRQILLDALRRSP